MGNHSRKVIEILKKNDAVQESLLPHFGLKSVIIDLLMQRVPIDSQSCGCLGLHAMTCFSHLLNQFPFSERDDAVMQTVGMIDIFTDSHRDQFAAE